MIFLSVLFFLLLTIGVSYLFISCKDKTEQIVFSLALFLKCTAAIGVGILYQVYYSGGDTFNYLHDLGLLAHSASEGYLFAEQPRAWFFVRLVYPLYMLSFCNYWVLSVTISVLSFVPTWGLYQELKHLNVKRWATQLSLFFIPTVVFWTSGLLKETVSFASINLIFILLLRVRRGTPFLLLHLLGAAMLSGLLFYLKYYLFAPLVIVSILFVTIHFTKRHLSLMKLVGVLFLVFISVTVGISALHPNMKLDFFLDALFNNHHAIGQSSKEALVPIVFDGSFISFLKVLPESLIIGLFCPTIFGSWNVLSSLLAIENLVVLLAFLFVGYRFCRGELIVGHKVLVILLLSYIFFLSVILPIASPNYGSLVRYRTSYYPFFVLLILEGIKKNRVPNRKIE